MKLTTAQINAFLQKPDPAAQVILIYGPDAGLVRERADALAKKAVPDLNDPFRVMTLTGSAIAEDPARLGDEMSAIAPGGGRRLIRVQQAGENIAPALAAWFAGGQASDSLLLLEAGDLEKRSKLRALCENEKTAAAMPCYIEDGATRQRIVSDILQSQGARISREALLFLCDILPPDRMAMRSELEKLVLYVMGAGIRDSGFGETRNDKKSHLPNPESRIPNAISIDDIRAAVQDAGAAELDDLIFAVGAGDAGRAGVLIDRLIEEQTSPVAILRAAQRHFIRLSWARYQLDAGASAADAVKKLQPPVFWKYADGMAAQLRRWPQTKIEKALQRLYDAEAAVKRTGSPDAALCAQLLLGLAA